MKNVTNILFCVIIAISMASCKKEKAALTKSELLCSGPWIQSSGNSIKQSDGSVTDIYTGLAACKKDDQFIFQPDKVYLQTEGASKCDPSHPQTSFTGTWAFTADESFVTISAPGAGTITARLVDITASSLKLENTQGGYIVTVTYRH